MALKRAFAADSLALGPVVALGLLGQQDAALKDGDFAQQLVELLVVADGQLPVTRDDARAALPASSRISTVRYSSTAARYTGAPAPTRSA